MRKSGSFPFRLAPISTPTEEVDMKIKVETTVKSDLGTETAENFGEAEGVSFVAKTVRNNITVAAYELTSGSFEFSITAEGIAVK
jgi:hypothetical protein